VLRLHADRVETAERERRVLGRFTRAHPTVPIIDVPAMATDVHDLDGLREIGRRLAS
jgi:predicted lysophospholipase L1 biosynthesis ABC-type transport system permease subunit